MEDVNKLESIILNDFFEILNSNKIDYCVMNNYEEMPEIIPSDVDFTIDKKSFNSLDYLIIKLAKKHNVVITQKIWHGYNKCAYILSPLHVDKYFWLQLDFFVDFCAKGYPNLIPYDDMVSSKVEYKNFFIPIPEIEVPFIIQRRIIKGDMNKKHLKRIKLLYNKSQKGVENSLISIFGNEASEILIKVIESKNIFLFEKNFNFFQKTLKKISNKNATIFYNFFYYLNQIKRAFYRLIYPIGLSIGIIGNNIQAQKQFIDSVDSKIDGSFHGTFYQNPNSFYKFIKSHFSSIYWSKVTKKKVYINLYLKTKNWNIFFNNFIIKIFRIKPDIIINYKNEFGGNESILKKYTFQILQIQSYRTQRHLNNRFSQTSGKKFKDSKI